MELGYQETHRKKGVMVPHPETIVNISARALGPSVSLSVRNWLFQGAFSEGTLGSKDILNLDSDFFLNFHG